LAVLDWGAGRLFGSFCVSFCDPFELAEGALPVPAVVAAPVPAEPAPAAPPEPPPAPCAMAGGEADTMEAMKMAANLDNCISIPPGLRYHWDKATGEGLFRRSHGNCSSDRPF
jgi:hypothetical protein